MRIPEFGDVGLGSGSGAMASLLLLDATGCQNLLLPGPRKNFVEEMHPSGAGVLGMGSEGVATQEERHCLKKMTCTHWSVDMRSSS